MNLDQIGFYTLSDERARTASATSRLSRCELVLTPRCKFKCPYCRHVGVEMTFDDATAVVTDWSLDHLRNVRFSGGEPTLWSGLSSIVRLCRGLGMERIALSTNGSAQLDMYRELLDAGVNDLSISLDACCALDGDRMSGGVPGSWKRVVENICSLSSLTYVTVGVVLTEQNVAQTNGIVRLASECGVADIRIIPAAQNGRWLSNRIIDAEYTDRYPILRYRVNNLRAGRPVRGITSTDSRRCGLVLDDMAVTGDKHYPCIIYMREGGKPIGNVRGNMRQDRLEWFSVHDTHTDPICSSNCLDVCVDYNNRFDEHHNSLPVAR